MRTNQWVVLAAATLCGCAIQSAGLAPPNDVDQSALIALPVSGHGDWSRLLRRELAIGDYRTEQLDYSLWQTAPTRSRETVGDPERGLSGGTERVRNNSRYAFQLTQAGAPLAEITCRQALDVSGFFLAYAEDAYERSELSANERYVAELACDARAIAPNWPSWTLRMAARDGRPFFGVLRTDALSHAVIGTQSSGLSDLGETTGFYLRRGERTVATVQRLTPGAMQVAAGLESVTERAVVAAAMALLLANDPVTAE